jgi:hypothetical protein
MAASDTRVIAMSNPHLGRSPSPTKRTGFCWRRVGAACRLEMVTGRCVIYSRRAGRRQQAASPSADKPTVRLHAAARALRYGSRLMSAS